MGTYIFPDILGNFMKKIDLRTQYEASMMSMSLMLIGMIISGFYVALYIDFPMWYKIVLIINFLAGFVFISSFITTTFQQYVNYMEVVKFQSQNMKGGQ